MQAVFDTLRVRVPRVTTLDPTPYFCDATACHYRDGQSLLYDDGDHLSPAGARRLAPLFDEWLATVQP